MESAEPERRAADVALWERLVRYHRTATRQMDTRLRGRFSRSLDDYDVLHQLTVAGGALRMGDLAEALLIANSSCTRIVRRLADGGLVARTRGTTDRRVVNVELTESGRQMHRRMAAVHTRDIERLFGDRLSDGGRSALARVLDQLSIDD